MLGRLVAAVLVVGASSSPARAQGAPELNVPAAIGVDGNDEPGARAGRPEDPGFAGLNPIEILARAGEALPGGKGVDGAGKTPGKNGEPGGGLSTALNIVVVLTVIGLAPSIMLMTTCFVRIIVVLGLLKQALGTNQLPPPQVILGLALFMTLLVMTPTIERIHKEAIVPYRSGQIRDYTELWDKAKTPLRDFMFDQIEATGNWSSLYMVLNYRGADTSHPEKLTRADVDMVSLVPAYMLSELKTAFLMGFRVYLPFLVIDMVIASLLISMSMMMLPPVLISLPFKLLLFVMVDGWQLVVGSLMTSFVTGSG
jgi:flagellar biosynthetic protein FliP